MAKCLLRVSKLVGMCNIVSLQKRERERRRGNKSGGGTFHFMFFFYVVKKV